MELLEKIFSVKNEYSSNKKHKVITIFGIKFKFKVKNNLIKDANKYWNSSKNSQKVQDYSHFRGIGRWTEANWINAGEKYKTEILNYFSKYDSEFLKNLKNKTALEWGVGGGINIRILCDLFNSVSGVDISKTNLEETKKQMQTFGISNYLDFLIDAEKFANLLKEVKNNSIDFILCVATFQHMPSQEYCFKVLKVMNKLMAPNSYALFQIRHDDGTEQYKSKNENYNKNVITFTSFTTEQFNSYLDKADFETIESKFVKEENNYEYFFVKRKN